MTKNEFIATVNEWSERKIPFLFMIDFELEDPQVFELNSISASNILFNINGFSNHGPAEKVGLSILKMQPLPLGDYSKKFSIVHDALSYGDSYLTNLTVRTPISLDHTLKEIYHSVHAKYKLYYENRFVVFSPECFVRIIDGRIYAYPMKGTIDASVADASRIILNDKKELAEHVTIVDLIRNDLSIVADNVEVTRFRYIDEIRTSEKNLLQVSSEICGILRSNFRQTLGEIIWTLLPAGSVSGAPKTKTLQIIQHAESEKRGFYTGVFGYFNGERLDSGVMIRFIENNDGEYFYRSGGGITTQSTVEKEYQEIIDKVYVPVD